MQLTYAIIFVADMQRSVTFYRDVVGLSLRFESSEWTEFDTGSATLALHAAQEESESGMRSVPEGTAAGSCRPGLQVHDLDAFHRRMLEHHVSCLQQPKATFGVRIAQYADPDQLSFSVSEQPAKRASDAT